VLKASEGKIDFDRKLKKDYDSNIVGERSPLPNFKFSDVRVFRELNVKPNTVILF
jgi:hypothetical protein